MEYEKMYADEPDKWQPTDEADMRERLSAYYKDVDAVLETLNSGETVRTPWAFYRKAAS